MSAVLLEPSVATFANLIVSQNRLGFGFVPFVGSGLSAPSGILMGMEFTEYLAYTVYRLLSDTAAAPKWDLRQHGWPKFPTAEEVRSTTEWFKSQFQVSCQRFGLVVEYDDQSKVRRIDFDPGATLNRHGLSELVVAIGRPLIPALLKGANLWELENQLKSLADHWRMPEGNQTASGVYLERTLSPDSHEQLVDTAIRAGCDWRSTLLFLSKIRVLDHRRIVLAESDRSIIDAFNTHITRDKQPSLGHKMLAHLNRCLRSRMVLTTNFDNLLEEAFVNICHDLNVISVSVRGELPDPKTVFSKDCIIKMHGSILETRADYSLDDLPPLEDQRRFAAYLGAQEGTSGKEAKLPKHLLVIGYSGSDLRCLQMIKHAMETIPDLRVYWICFNQNDFQNLQRNFREKAFQGRIHSVITARPDLFLYELYQRLNYSLPSGGFAYQFAARVPPQRVRDENPDTQRRVLTVIEKFEGAQPQNLDVIVNQVGAGLTPEKCDDLYRAVISRKVAEFVEHSVVRGRRQTSHPVQNRYDGLLKISQEYEHLARLPAADSRLAGDLAEPGWITLVQHRSGSIDAADEIMTSLETQHRRKVIWVEQQDYADVFSLMHDIFTNIAMRVGVYQLEHVLQMPKLDLVQLAKTGELLLTKRRSAAPAIINNRDTCRLVTHLSRFVLHLGLKPREWVIMVYGRNTAGSCSAWGGDEFFWNENQFHAHWTFISCLARIGFQVVYFPYDEGRIKGEGHKKKFVDDELKELRKDYAAPSVPPPLPFRGSFPVSEPHVLDPAAASVSWSRRSPNGRTHYERIIRKITDDWIRPWCDSPVLPGNLEGNVRSLQARSRFSFIYAMTLFRQSRHISACFIDGAYKCPFRFNFRGYDNEWVRATKVQEWLSELRDQQVLYEKAGGFLWMHRDVRLGVQQICEGLSLDEVATRMGSATPAKPHYQGHYVSDFRSGMHFNIADWYLKAFLTNGHWMPAIECLYHFGMSAAFAYTARPLPIYTELPNPERVAEYRLDHYRNSVNEMLKALALFRPYLQFWLADSNGNAMFSQIKQADPIELVDDRLPKLLKESLLKLQESSSGAPTFGKKVTEIERLNDQLCRLVGIVGYESIETKIVGESKYISTFEFGPTQFDNPSGIEEFPKSDVSTEDWQEAWLNYFDKANANFVREMLNVIQRIRSHHSIKDYHRQEVDETVSRGRGDWLKKGPRPDQVYNLVEALGEFSYLQTRDTKRLYHKLVAQASDSNKHPRAKFFRPKSKSAEKQDLADWENYIGEVRSKWLAVSVLCNAGLTICRNIDSVMLPKEIPLRCKLLTLYGLALANLDRFYEAHRHLTEASAYLSKSARGLDPVSLGIIRLRRAEVYLTEALRIGDFRRELRVPNLDFEKVIFKCKPLDTLAEPPVPFLQAFYIGPAFDSKKPLHEYFSGCKGNVQEIYSCVPARIQEIIRELGESVTAMELERHLKRAQMSALDDAAATLDLVERNISGRSQHSLWWGRLYTLRLKIFATEAELNRTEPVFHGLIRRKPVQHDAIHFEIYRKGILSTVNSAFRQLRIMDYYLECPHERFEHMPADGRETMRQRIQEVRHDFDGLERAFQDSSEWEPLEAYRNAVREKIKDKEEELNART